MVDLEIKKEVVCKKLSRDFTQHEDELFTLEILQGKKLVGKIFVFQHPHSKEGAEVHLEIARKWRKKWLSRGLRDKINKELLKQSKECNIKMIYSTALVSVSPRLLEFFGFIEYYKKQPKTYYYLEVI